ncbi:MAG: YbaK/EbsC family protein [Thermoanaerobaculia bacterium]
MNALLADLKTSILQHPPLSLPKKRRVELLLGNDREIGREVHSQEKRVGITPDQVRDLRGFFSDLWLDLSVLVVQGAGQRAGFSDADYVAAGAEILTPEELEYQDGPPDVVHALKEPSRYESGIPGPFCRIGALHTGDFHSDSGLASLLEKRHIAIFDGSHTGAPGAFRIPIRGGMSIFAGKIAAEWVLEHLQHRHLSGRAVVVGAGNAGQAAVSKLAERDDVTEVHLLNSDEYPARLEQIRANFAAEPKVKIYGIRGTNHPQLVQSLTGAEAVIFAVARPGEEAPRVVHIETLEERLADGAVVVDISIDEKGAIHDPAIPRSWTSREIIDHFSKVLGSHRNRVYHAITNMPRAYPKEASVAHGEAILPYLATLLFLAAREEGAAGVAQYLERRPFEGHSLDPRSVGPDRVLDALVQDLRNGMAFYPHDGRIVMADTVADRAGVFDFLYRRKIPFEFSSPSAPVGSEADREREKSAFSVFPDPIRNCLSYAVDHGAVFTFLSHPGIGDAKRALGAGPDQVLKCLVFRADENYVAAICTGRKHVLEERLRELTGVREVHLASPDEVLQVTGHTAGGVPAVQVFAAVSAIYVDEAVMQQEAVYSSGGTEFASMRIAPATLKELGGRVVSITWSAPAIAGPEFEFDLFICHSSEDKEAFVEALARRLKERNLQVWYDSFKLKLGDRLRPAIDGGLSRSRFGIVILSPSFFRKDWTRRELEGLLALERGGRKVILPLWHGVTYEDVTRFSPMLADRVALDSSLPLDKIVDQILEVVRE